MCVHVVSHLNGNYENLRLWLTGLNALIMMLPVEMLRLGAAAVWVESRVPAPVVLDFTSRAASDNSFRF